MIYKVQFQIHRRGYRKLRLEGLYVLETGSEMSVPEMKHDVTEFIKRQLSSRNKEFENFQNLRFLKSSKPISCITRNQVKN